MPDSTVHAFDFIAIGEILSDLISCTELESLKDANTYQRFVGGQPTNLSRNMALLGNNTALAACVGSDTIGEHIIEQLRLTSVDTRYLQTIHEAPTTIVLVAKTRRGTPDFVIYRGADAHIQGTRALLETVAKSRILHTSAFAISREPARTTIFNALRIAQENNTLISFDPNFHPTIWPDTLEFLSILEQIYKFVDYTKPSLDDCERIFSPGLTPAEYCHRFIEWGAKTVILTMGDQGILVSTASGEQYTLYPNDIQVADVTGAGDAFWAGFLSAIVEGKSNLEAALQGQALAEIKIGTVGPLENNPPSQDIEKRISSIQYTQTF